MNYIRRCTKEGTVIQILWAEENKIAANGSINKGSIRKSYKLSGTLATRSRQRYQIARMEAVITALDALPCDVDIRIKKDPKKHVATREGSITAYGDQTQSLASGLIEELYRFIREFTAENPKSTLELRYRQTIQPNNLQVAR